ncbi:MAG: hypothetical protein LBJ00_08480 [Planctomycetaceae bacterium]|jgi:hypothetical protein|nr:hypothetical protein [Planctomycetaceae bacterium]
MWRILIYGFVVFSCVTLFISSIVDASDDVSIILIDTEETKLFADIDVDTYSRLKEYIEPHRILRTNDDSVMWSFDKFFIDGSISRFDIEKNETKNFNLSQIINSNNNHKIAPFIFNKPNQVQFDISMNGKYLLIRRFADTTIVYDIEKEKVVELNSKKWSEKKDETIIGFDRKGNLYCGVQSIAPIAVLRDFNTGDILRQYRFPRLNYPPLREDYSHWNTTKDQNEVGLNFNYLSSTIESPDGKYTLFTFTVYQFRCLFVILLICDNNSQRIISKHLLDTSDWNTNVTKFVFDKNGKKLLFQDGRVTIYCFDLEKRLITSRFEVPLRGDESESIAIAYEIESFFFTPSSDVVVQMRMPYAIIRNDSGTQKTPTSPLKMTYLWNPIDGKISFAKPWISDRQYALKHWISPDERIVAILSVEYDPNDFTIYNSNQSYAKLDFWDIKNNKLLKSIEDKNISSVIFSSDWRFVVIKTVTKSAEAKKRYKLVHVSDKSDNSTNRQSTIAINNSEYRYWESLSGQYSMTAKFISVLGIDKSDIANIDLSKLTNKIITIEKEQTKKLIKVKFGDLSINDQNYMLEQIKKQK